MKALLAASRDIERDDVWNALEWLSMPLFILYPQLVVLKSYRYG